MAYTIACVTGIRNLLNVLRLYHLPTFLHSRRVSVMARRVGYELGWRGDSLRLLCIFGLLHDVGKLAVDPAILEKPGRLAREEWEAICRHPIVGEQLVRRVTGSTSMAAWVRSHHERWDGNGYPDGIASDSIPLQARILSVVDAFDAMLDGRPYHRSRRTIKMALEEIERGAGAQFDPELADLFISMVRREGRTLAKMFPPSQLGGD
nr:HD-GYP domain-containing protein [Thermaerobacter marianensis]